MAELHSHGHVAGDLELATHEQLLAISLASDQVDIILVAHSHGAIRLALLALRNTTRGVLDINSPDLGCVVRAVDTEAVHATNLLSDVGIFFDSA